MTVNLNAIRDAQNLMFEKACDICLEKHDDYTEFADIFWLPKVRPALIP